MLRACAVWLALCGPVAAQDITRAELAEPTARYDHAVLGDALEWGALHLWLEGGERRTIRLPETRVFEDIEARLADLDGDGTREVVVVEADLARGAALAIYDAQGLRAAPPLSDNPTAGLRRLRLAIWMAMDGSRSPMSTVPICGASWSLSGWRATGSWKSPAKPG
jgi:hypothetical protein